MHIIVIKENCIRYTTTNLEKTVHGQSTQHNTDINEDQLASVTETY